jgi:hypothetical protein
VNWRTIWNILVIPGAPSALWRILVHSDSRKHFLRGYHPIYVDKNKDDQLKSDHE